MNAISKFPTKATTQIFYERERKKWRGVSKTLVALLIIGVLSTSALVIAINIYFPIRYLDIIEENAGELDLALILAVIHAESRFDPQAESHRGAQGLMQLMPPTAQWKAGQMGMTDFKPEDVWLPEVNIAIGVFYLNWLISRYDGNINLALAAYNAGLGNVDRWLANTEFSSDGLTLDVIPFLETHNYLIRVNQRQRIYQVLLTIRNIF